MKKILLPTDFSANAYNAIKYAVQLFSREQCVFYLLNTYTPPLYHAGYIHTPAHMDKDQECKNNSYKNLVKTQEEISSEFENELHRFEIISAFSHLSEQIKVQVKSKNIDVVVMGTQGATGAEQILFGTNTVHAIKIVNCPLLAIPPLFPFTTPQNILFPSDYEINYTEDHLRVLKEISQRYQSKIHVLNVSFGHALNKSQKQAQQLVGKYLSPLDHAFHNIESETVIKGIYQFKNDQQTDLMAMISNKHSFFEKILFRPVITEISFALEVPLLVMPSGKYNT